jgi:hypothetical protein
MIRSPITYLSLRVPRNTFLLVWMMVLFGQVRRLWWNLELVNYED